MTTGQLIKELQRFKANTPVMILIPVRKDQPQWEFVEELKLVTDWERNDAPDCPQLCTRFFYKAVTNRTR